MEKEFAAAKQELIGTANEIQNVNDALRNVRFENITNVINDLDTAKGILSSIADLIQDDWMYDEGELSEYGRAKVALLVSQLEDSQKKANEYLNLYNEIQNNKDTYASDKAYMEDLNNAVQNYYNTLGETATLENSIVELMRKSAQEEIDNLNKIIDARKKALQKKKEYYDYNKTLKNSQKEIDSIKAQIDAIENLSGAMDTATKAKLAQLKADLAEKEESLQETKDDHTYNLQIDALDEFASSLEDALNDSTKSVAEIMADYKNAINDAADIYKTSTDSVNDTLNKITAFYGGTGTGIDGTGLDLTPKGTDNGTTGNGIGTINISVPSTNSNNGFLNTATGEADETQKIISENLAKAAALFEKYGTELLNPERIYKVNDPQMLELVNRQFSVMLNPNQNVPEYVKKYDVQQNITIHYDNMINVEGSVDKSFSVQFKKDADEICNGVVNKLVKGLKQNGVNFVRRPTLPTVR